MVVVGCSGLSCGFFFVFYTLILAFFVYAVGGWVDGRGFCKRWYGGTLRIIAYGFLLAERACIDCRRLILFSLQYTRVLRAVRSGYRTFANFF